MAASLPLASGVQADAIPAKRALQATEEPPPTEAVPVVEMDGVSMPFTDLPAPAPVPISVQKSLPMPDVDVQLSVLDVERLREEDKVRKEDLEEKAQRIGVIRTLPVPAIVVGQQSSLGRWLQFDEGGALWQLTIESPGAEAFRVHVEDAFLAAGTQIIVYDTSDPVEAYGPYTAQRLGDQKDLWTETVFASTVTLELYLPTLAEADATRLFVQEVAHVYAPSADWLSAQEGTCHNDAMCFNDWINTANAVAGIGTIGQTGVLWCSGALLNDLDPETFTGYFMTANHCLSDSASKLSTQAQADTIEFYWRYQTDRCRGVVPNPANVPRTAGGADLISVKTGNDHAFLRVRGQLPGGLHFAGWTTGTPSEFDTLTGIHHPDGSFKRLSRGGRLFFSGNYLTVRWSSGVTEPGSSGSPLFNPDQRFIGQLSDGFSSCKNRAGPDDYGRFSATYPRIRRWLEIGGTINVNHANRGVEEGTPARPFNMVSEANDFAWNGARIRIRAGAYPEALTFSRRLTILADRGVVTIGEAAAGTTEDEVYTPEADPDHNDVTIDTVNPPTPSLEIGKSRIYLPSVVR